MNNGKARSDASNPVVIGLLVVALVGLGVLGYLYYRQQQEVVNIDVPGFEASITKGDGVDIEIGKDK
jgi:hypothetical protein